jgi:hypothetical protein
LQLQAKKKISSPAWKENKSSLISTPNRQYLYPPNNINDYEYHRNNVSKCFVTWWDMLASGDIGSPNHHHVVSNYNRESQWYS